MTRQRPLAVVDLRLLARGKLQAVELLGVHTAQATHEALDAVVARAKSKLIHQVLVDRLGVALEANLLLDPGAVPLTLGAGLTWDGAVRFCCGNRSRWPQWGNLALALSRAGGHPGGI